MAPLNEGSCNWWGRPFVGVALIAITINHYCQLKHYCQLYSIIQVLGYLVYFNFY